VPAHGVISRTTEAKLTHSNAMNHLRPSICLDSGIVTPFVT